MTETADFILSIPADQPERLFKRDDVEGQFKRFLKRWHPDVNSDPMAGQVTARISELRDKARQKIEAGVWDEVGLLSLRSNGRRFNIRYKKKVDFELGEIYYGSGICCFLVAAVHENLFNNFVSTASTLHFADARMKAEMGRYLPTIKKAVRLDDGRYMIIIEKPHGTYLLSDLKRAMGGKIPHEHVAWIMSSLLNICCYLQWSRMSHGDISENTVFVQPSTHSVYMFGGWWYTTEIGSPLSHIPVRTYQLAPRDSIGEKRADPRTDLLLVRSLCKELLGDPSGMALDAPEAFRDFLNRPSSGSALEDYGNWREKFLPASYDVRRFVPLEINDSDVFKEKQNG